jgi:purine-cytosine permease-like protein
MVQSRYSFGYYGAIIPAFLNAVTMMGFMVLNCILAGETLSLVAGGGMSWDVGIAVIAVISLFVSPVNCMFSSQVSHCMIRSLFAGTNY